MGIKVECPHGHIFKVKDKYAGRKGLCPRCPGQVVVQVPDLLTSQEATYRKAVADEVRASHTAAGDPSSSSVLDDVLADDASSSGSLLGSSVIRHHVKCKCGQAVPMWFAKCPSCGNYMPQR